MISGGVGVMVWVMVCGVVMADSDSDRLIVTTTQGKISGVKKTSLNGRPFYAFNSIPYAMPPVGHLRLRDPVPGGAWEGVRDGVPLPPMCPKFNRLEKTVFQGQEDCLFLNVYTPKPGSEGVGLPVMVYIFGGAFREGRLIDYNGDVLLNHDVVLVIMQYRLGLLGWLSTEDSIIPGNFALKDQTLALRWVQENIRNFGGDPKKVTIFGNSSGAACVHAHILSPHSRGLFVRAILQSGTMFLSNIKEIPMRKVAHSTGRFLDCPSTRGMRSDQASNSLLTCLQNVDIQNLTLSILNHWLYPSLDLMYKPRVDGDFIPDDPQVLMAQGRYNLVDLMSGVSQDEGGFYVRDMFLNEVTKWELLNNFDVQAPEFLPLRKGPFMSQLARQVFQHYVGGVRIREEDVEALCKMLSDLGFIISQEQVSLLHIRNTFPNKNTFYYVFRHLGQRTFYDRPSNGFGKHWVVHADEVFYLYTSKTLEALEWQADQRMRDIITTLWTNFARTGNPTPDESLGFVWEPASPGNLHHLSLTLNPRMQPDTNQETRDFHESLLTQDNLLMHPEKVLYGGKPVFSGLQSQTHHQESHHSLHHHPEL